MSKKLFVLLIPFLFAFGHVSSQNNGQKIKWLEWDEGYAKAKKDNVVLFVYIHTFNCPWCKKMEMTTLKDPEITNRLNAEFVCVDFNPEIEKTYTVDGRSLTNVELLAYITQNVYTSDSAPLGYPAMVFILVDYDEKFLENGYQESDLFGYVLDSALDIKAKKDKKATKKKKK